MTIRADAGEVAAVRELWPRRCRLSTGWTSWSTMLA
jgi:hypothetical protein